MTRNGVPVADLVPHQTSREPRQRRTLAEIQRRFRELPRWMPKSGTENGPRPTPSLVLTIRSKTVGAPAVRRVTGLRDAILDTSVVIAVTIAELAYGLNVDDPIRRGICIERFHATLEEFEVLPFDTAAAKLYGVLAAIVRQAGQDPRPCRMDLQIAATAASNRLPLVTRNPDDLAGLERLVTALPI